MDRFVQTKNPRTGRYVLIDRKRRTLKHKKSDGLYKGIPVARKRNITEEVHIRWQTK